MSLYIFAFYLFISYILQFTSFYYTVSIYVLSIFSTDKNRNLKTYYGITKNQIRTLHSVWISVLEMYAKTMVKARWMILQLCLVSDHVSVSVLMVRIDYRSVLIRTCRSCTEISMCVRYMYGVPVPLPTGPSLMEKALENGCPFTGSWVEIVAIEAQSHLLTTNRAIRATSSCGGTDSGSPTAATSATHTASRARLMTDRPPDTTESNQPPITAHTNESYDHRVRTHHREHWTQMIHMITHDSRFSTLTESFEHRVADRCVNTEHKWFIWSHESRNSTTNGHMIETAVMWPQHANHKREVTKPVKEIMIKNNWTTFLLIF